MIRYAQKKWEECHKLSLAAIAIQSKPLDYLCEEFAWGSLPYDLAAISSYNLGKFSEALSFGEEAYRIDPTNKRLANNVDMYRVADANQNV
jgi:hypothetical protein